MDRGFPILEIVNKHLFDTVERRRPSALQCFLFFFAEKFTG